MLSGDAGGEKSEHKRGGHDDMHSNIKETEFFLCLKEKKAFLPLEAHFSCCSTLRRS